MDRSEADNRGQARNWPIANRPLKGALRGRYRLRVGKWRIFFSLDGPGSVVVTDVDNRGQAY